LRCDAVNPPLLGMSKVVSEDALRRALAKIDEGGHAVVAGASRLFRPAAARRAVGSRCRCHDQAALRPSEPAPAEAGEGAVIGYNPRKPGRPPAFAGAGSHCYHTYLLSDLRLVLRVEVHPGDQHNPKHAAAGLWSLLAPLGRERWPRLLRG